MCDCLNEMLDKVKEKVVEQIGGDADLGTLEIEYQNRVFRFDSKKNNVMLKINYSYYRTKTTGERYKNRTNTDVNLAMSHCPFCGEKYE